MNDDEYIPPYKDNVYYLLYKLKMICTNSRRINKIILKYSNSLYKVFT